jgi:hypothetical protein
MTASTCVYYQRNFPAIYAYAHDERVWFRTRDWHGRITITRQHIEGHLCGRARSE